MYKALMLWVLCVGSCWADEWSTADTYREVGYQTLLVIDWAQTRNMARANWTTRTYGDTWYQDHPLCEVNPVLGKHPGVKRVDRYFALAILAHFGFAYALPKDWRSGVQYVTIGVEFGFVQHNRMMGISAKF